MKIEKLPGLIDVHTHLRVPGGEHKEDFATGTASALAGGMTMVLGMPNTTPPITSADVMLATHEAIKRDALCDVGMYAAASSADVEQLPTLADLSIALKIYLNDTFGKLRVDELPTMMRCFELWPRHKLIAMHAEKQSVAVGIGLATAYNRPVHFCHISRREEIELIAQAKKQGLPVTCEVAPHHLFMDRSAFEQMGPLADMRPILGSADDVAALWEHIDSTIDMIATDHAPHTLAEKRSATPPPGVSGLQTSLPLMLTAVAEGRLSLQRVIDLMYTHPKRIFKLPDQPDTHIEVDLDDRYILRNSDQLTKCGWTPFDGREVIGRIVRVVLRGIVVYENGKICVEGGFGRILS